MIYRLYIGSNNNTHIIDTTYEQTILDIIGRTFPSFTYQRATGVFKGVSEDTMIVTIANASRDEVETCANALRTKLKQEGIGFECNNEYVRVV